MTSSLCPDCGNARRPGRWHPCVDGKIRHDVDDRPPKMTAKQAHMTTRADALTCQGCGAAAALLVEIPRPTAEQVEDARKLMAAVRMYTKHGLAKLVPVEDLADRKIREQWRYSAGNTDTD